MTHPDPTQANDLISILLSERANNTFEKSSVLLMQINLIDGPQIRVNLADRLVETHPSWLELMFDFAIVIAARKVSTGYNTDLNINESTAGIIYFALLLTLWIIRASW